MDDDKKTKKQLIGELKELRQCVAELKGFEEEIKQTRVNHEKFTKAFLQNSISASITTLKEGRFLDVSNAFLRVTGYKRDEIIGHTSTECGLITEEQRASFFNELNKRGHIENFEMKVRTKGGAFRDGLFNGVMMSLSNEKYLLTVITDITERKQAEEDLRMSEERFRILSEAAFEAIAIHENGVLIQANDQCLSMFGYEPGEAFGKEMMSVTTAPEVLKDMIKYITADGLGPYEAVGVRKDGTRFPMEIRVRKMAYKGCIARVGVIRDITERKQAEERLYVSEERFRILSEAAFEAIAIHEEGVLLHANDQYFKMFGYEPGEALGKEMMSLTIAPEALVAAKRQLATDSLEPYESVGIRKDGARFPMEIRARKMAYKGRIVRFGVIADMTERKQMESLYRTLANNAQSAICIIQEGRFCFVNPHATVFTGYETSELIGMDPVSLIHPDDRESTIRSALRMIRGELSSPYGFRGVHKDGSFRWIMETATPIVFDGKSAFLLNSMDITERKRVEAQLWENQERLRLSLEAGEQGFIDWDVQNDHLHYSDLQFEILGYGRDELEPRVRSWNKLIHPQDKAAVIRTMKDHLDGITDHYEATYRLIKKSGGWRWFRLHAKVVNRDDNGSPLRMMGTITDATSEKEIEQELEKRVAERTAELVEVNAALKVLLKQRELDKTDTEETMAANLKLLVLPHLHKLKKSNLNAEHKAWVSLIDENLGKVSSPFIKNLNSKYSVLTPKELQVAEHIRSGKTSKEIADMMNLSPRTVDVFRHSLRKKLGLNNKKINLQSLLSSL